MALVGVTNLTIHFPALTAVIGTHQNAVVVEGQACQFMARVLTKGFALLFPRRLEVSRFSLCHATSSSFLGH